MSQALELVLILLASAVLVVVVFRSLHLPPLACRHNGWLVVLGQRKWNIQGGFPNLCHGGLSLLEAAVPYVELPPI